MFKTIKSLINKIKKPVTYTVLDQYQTPGLDPRNIFTHSLVQIKKGKKVIYAVLDGIYENVEDWSSCFFQDESFEVALEHWGRKTKKLRAQK